MIAKGAILLSHDFTRGYLGNTEVGNYCLIGVNAIILPGISIGDHVVVGARAVVTKDIKSNSLVVGNPARRLRHINTGAYGRILHHE